MDETWVPSSLRTTLREILATVNTPPFRFYYRRLKQRIEGLQEQNSYAQLVELGAGTAPVTRELLKCPTLANTKLLICDLNPDVARYEVLKKIGAGRIDYIRHPVDFGDPSLRWPKNSLLMLSSVFHHIPFEQRARVLSQLTHSQADLLIAEAIRCNLLTGLGCLFTGTLAALLTPIRWIRQKGFLRRVFWCWLTPIGALCFTWDGVASVWRCWTNKEWTAWAREYGHEFEIKSTPMTTYVLVRGLKENEDSRSVAN